MVTLYVILSYLAPKKENYVISNIYSSNLNGELNQVRGCRVAVAAANLGVDVVPCQRGLGGPSVLCHLHQHLLLGYGSKLIKKGHGYDQFEPAAPVFIYRVQCTSIAQSQGLIKSFCGSSSCNFLLASSMAHQPGELPQ